MFSQIIRMLKKSFRKVKSTQNIILHSDQGWQYQMKAYQNILKEKLYTEEEREELWIQKQEEGYKFIMGEKHH